MESLPIKNINDNIFEIRGLKVMLDSDLAKLYQVETKRINEAVKNNSDKFPREFYFELTQEEFEILRSKFSTAKFSKSRTLPKVFTEQGVYMLATIVKSKIATNVTLTIIKTFARIREFALNYQDITKRLNEIEKTMKTDQQQTNYNTHKIDEAFELLNQILKDTKDIDKNLIGFRPV
jgi:hypothetical protein